MVRAQVYFDEREYEAVRQAAFKERVSISALIRRLVDEQVLGRKKKKGGSAAEALLKLSGLVRDHRRDVSERHDDYLWGEET